MSSDLLQHLPPYASIATALPVALGLYACYRVLSIGSREKGLPPGPPTKPILGNLLEFPVYTAHFRFTQVR